MGNGRDLNRTRDRIISAALVEFSAKGLAGARTDAIARRARVNESMIFYCFKTKEGLYQEVMRRRLTQRLTAEEPYVDFPTSLVRGYQSVQDKIDFVRLWEWEALDGRRRKLLAEDERRSLYRGQIAYLRQAKARRELPAEVDEKMLALTALAVQIFPLAFPQAVQLICGLEADDARFRRRWSKVMRWLGERIADNKVAREPSTQENAE